MIVLSPNPDSIEVSKSSCHVITVSSSYSIATGLHTGYWGGKYFRCGIKLEINPPDNI